MRIVSLLLLSSLTTALAVPAAPENLVKDDANLFSETEIKQVVTVLKGIQKNDAFSCYVVTQEKAPAADYAKSLKQAWVKGAGSVVVYAKETGKSYIAFPDGIGKYLGATEQQKLIHHSPENATHPEKVLRAMRAVTFFGSLAERRRKNSKKLKPLPQAPATMVLDDGRLFSAEQLTKISQLLTKKRDETGIHIYVATFSFLYNETIQQRTRRLRDQWVNVEHGAVISYSRAQEEMGFSADPDPVSFLTEEQIGGIYANAVKVSDREAELADKLIKAIELISVGLRKKGASSP